MSSYLTTGKWPHTKKTRQNQKTVIKLHIIEVYRHVFKNILLVIIFQERGLPQLDFILLKQILIISFPNPADNFDLEIQSRLQKFLMQCFACNLIAIHLLPKFYILSHSFGSPFRRTEFLISAYFLIHNLQKFFQKFRLLNSGIHVS